MVVKPCDDIPHELKLSIRWHECDGAIRFKLAQLHASMKGTVLNLNRLTFLASSVACTASSWRGACVSLHLDFVIQAKLRQVKNNWFGY